VVSTDAVGTDDVDGGRVDVLFREMGGNCGSSVVKEAELVLGDVVDLVSGDVVDLVSGDVVDLVSGDGDVCEGGGREEEEVDELEKSQMEFNKFIGEFTSPKDFLSKVRS
jgi:hypothetical protein